MRRMTAPGPEDNDDVHDLVIEHLPSFVYYSTYGNGIAIDADEPARIGGALGCDAWAEVDGRGPPCCQRVVESLGLVGVTDAVEQPPDPLSGRTREVSCAFGERDLVHGVAQFRKHGRRGVDAADDVDVLDEVERRGLDRGDGHAAGLRLARHDRARAASRLNTKRSLERPTVIARSCLSTTTWYSCDAWWAAP